MKMASIVSGVSLFAAVSAFAASSVPVVDNVDITQSGSTVKIGYDFTGDAGIVTLDIQTNTLSDASGNWVSIGIDNFGTNVSGAAFCVVKGTGKKEIKWKPAKAWPGRFAEKGTIRAHLTAYATNTPPRWMAIPLVINATTKTRFYDREVPGGITNRIYKTDTILMRKIEVACMPWTMGNTVSGDTRKHEVVLTEDYYIGIYEFTRGQAQAGGLTATEYDEVSAVKPYNKVAYSDVRGWDYIYTYNNRKHAVADASYIGQLRKRTAVPLDLPSEAEWECAARAGRYGVPANWEVNIVNKEAWTGSHVSDVQEVGTKAPNDWDMYDMLGNCCEFVLDFYGTGLLDPYFASPDAKVDPHGPAATEGAKLIMLVGEGVGHTSDYYGLLWSSKKNNYQYYSAVDTGFRLWAPGIVSWE